MGECDVSCANEYSVSGFPGFLLSCIGRGRSKMHDIEKDPKKRMPPLIVLGLTGPVGSGCTTLSSILDNPNVPEESRGQSLVNALRVVGWVKVSADDEIKINWEKLNDRVDASYNRKSEKLRNNDGNSGQLTRAEVMARDRHHQLLELREAAKALSKLAPYHSKHRHLFRTLSVSDLIVYRALMAMERREFTLNDVLEPHKRKKYHRFVTIAHTHMDSGAAKQARDAAGVDTYTSFYKRWYTACASDEVESLGIHFNEVYGIARKIKRAYHKSHPLEYAEVLQDFGDNIRRCGNPFGLSGNKLPESSCKLARDISQIIRKLYGAKSSAFFVVDCLRNPYEVMYLRREFANFFLLSLFAEEPTRRERIISLARHRVGHDLAAEETKAILSAFEEADKRDSGRTVKNEEALYKQDVTRCVAMSDIAISNDTQWTSPDATAVEDLCRKSLRLLCLILSPGCTKPNNHEMFMNLAYTMAVKSNCISRQVGAVIVGPEGYVVGAGWNDTGKGRVSCGLRAIRDLEREEFRAVADAMCKEGEDYDTLIDRLAQKIGGSAQNDHAKQLCFCLKDLLAERKAIPAQKERLKRALGVEDEEAKVTLLEPERQFLNKAVEEDIAEEPPHQLEYCLALHAEENAILQSAKIGGLGLQGSTIYVTCQPCTLCAKKIQQVGISTVIYTQAYPKSMPDIYMAGVKAQQFEGVKPRGYVRLFMPYHDQKEWQYLENKGMVPAV